MFLPFVFSGDGRERPSCQRVGRKSELCVFASRRRYQAFSYLPCGGCFGGCFAGGCFEGGCFDGGCLGGGTGFRLEPNELNKIRMPPPACRHSSRSPGRGVGAVVRRARMHLSWVSDDRNLGRLWAAHHAAGQPRVGGRSVAARPCAGQHWRQPARRAITWQLVNE